MTEAYRTEFKTEPAEVKAGEPATLIFTVRDGSGETVAELAIEHERPMHLLAVSEDLSEFYHLHPERLPDGSFGVVHTFPHGGNYQLYADFTPPGGSQIVERISLRCDGAARPAARLVEDESPTHTVDGLSVTLRPEKPLRAGEEVMLDFAVADAATNAPATDLEPYLGALAHFVIVSEDGAEFLHAHPVQKADAGAAHAHGAHAGHGATAGTHGGAASNAAAAEVSAHTVFPRAGLYKIWAQFQRAGRVVTVPFVVRVAGA